MLRAGPSTLMALVAFQLAAPRAWAGDPDPWFGHDKLLHFEATSSLAIVGYGVSSFATEDRRLRMASGAALALGAGVAKELWDLDGHGDASWRDLTWDLVGAVSGVLVARGVDWLVHRLSPPPLATDR